MKKNILPVGIILLVIIAGLFFFKNEQAHNPFTAPNNLSSENTTPLPVPSSSSILGVFEGRTPCQDFLLEFTRDPAPGCQRIKWLLTFYQDPKTNNPTRYVFGVAGREDSHDGNWSIKRVIPSDSEAIIYQLTPDNSEQTISLLKVEDDHLFFLDGNMDLLVGNELFSYTLSKTE